MNCKTNLFNQIEFSPTEKSSLKFTFHLKSFHRKFQHPKLSLVVNNVHPVLYFSFLRLGLSEHWCGTNWNHFSQTHQLYHCVQPSFQQGLMHCLKYDLQLCKTRCLQFLFEYWDRFPRLSSARSYLVNMERCGICLFDEFCYLSSVFQYHP